MQKQRIPPVLVFAIFYAAYVLGGSLAWWSREVSDLGAVFFPPAGLTVVALLAFSRRRWPIVMAAVIAGEFTVGLTFNGSINVAALLGFSAANAVGPLVGATAVCILLGRDPGLSSLPDLGRRRELLAFSAAAVVVGPFVSSAIGAITAWWQFGSSVHSVGPQWWLGDALGVAVVAPALMTWTATRGARPWRGPAALTLTSAIWVGTIVVLAASNLPILFLPFAGLIVAGALFDVRTVALTGIVISIVVGTSLAIDPSGLVAGLAPSTALTTVKLQFLVFAMSAFLVAAEANESALAGADVARRLATVGDLQSLLLPPSTMSGHGFRVRGVYAAAIHDVGVGGDWYVVRPTLDGRLVFGVGDIVGHDLKAARAMVAIRSGLILDAAVTPDPIALLKRLDSFCDIEAAIKYSTAWIGVFDPETRLLEYACAGHPPPLLFATETAERLDGANTALIGIPQGERRVETITVPANAVVAIYSDGLIETRNATIDEGIDRLVDTIVSEGFEPQAVIDTMLRDSARHDDTILAVIDLDYVPVPGQDDGADWWQPSNRSRDVSAG